MGAEGCEVMAAKAESATGAKLKLAPGQPLTADLAKEIDVIIARYDGNPSSLINILHEVQKWWAFSRSRSSLTSLRSWVCPWSTCTGS